jgi:hypothetical protein
MLSKIMQAEIKSLNKDRRLILAGNIGKLRRAGIEMDEAIETAYREIREQERTNQRREPIKIKRGKL